MPYMPADQSRISAIFAGHQRANAYRTDRLFGVLLILQWALAVGLACVLSPRTWAGDASQTHPHVYAAVVLGGVLTSLPVLLAFWRPGENANRFVIAISQLLFSSLLIHVTGGRIETHFHIFGSLAFLAFYRDWRVLVLATVITALDHLLRGTLWPQSVYGVLQASYLRALEHSAWVLFEDAFLFVSIFSKNVTFRLISEKQYALESQVSTIEAEVRRRTEELVAAQRVVLDQQQALVSSAKMSALGEMAGGVAHEINNPLAVIKNLASQLEEVVHDDPLDRQLLSEMTAKLGKTTDRIARIVQGLRFFSRDGSQDSVRWVNLGDLVEETVGFCSERFKSHSVTLATEIEAGLGFEGRPVEISQVLLNLLNNAYDAVAPLPTRWVRLYARQTDEHVEISVTDSGGGIPEAVRAKVFQPFFTTKAIGQGTGIGLSISSGIVASHGGQLTIDPASAHTRFVIRIPVRRAARMEAS